MKAVRHVVAVALPQVTLVVRVAVESVDEDWVHRLRTPHLDGFAPIGGPLGMVFTPPSLRDPGSLLSRVFVLPCVGEFPSSPGNFLRTPKTYVEGVGDSSQSSSLVIRTGSRSKDVRPTHQ